MRDLSADAVEGWLNGKSQVFATSSLEMVHSILRRAITHAQRHDKVGRNVAELVETPEGQVGCPSKSLTLQQAKDVLSGGASQSDWVHAYVVVSLLVGIRTEEVRPLKWNHVHLTPPDGVVPHIEVWRSVRRRGEMKTRKSRRTLAIPRQVVAVLDQHRTEQRSKREALGLVWDVEGYVFGTDSGEQRTADQVRRNFRALLRRAGIDHPETWTPRELRHSFVSLLSDHGIPIEVIARVVGHSTTVITESVYRKQLRPVITEGAEAMDAIFDDGEAATS